MSNEKNKGYLKQFFNYFLKFGSTSNANASFSIKAMHWINRIAIIMFLIAIGIYVAKRL